MQKRGRTVSGKQREGVLQTFIAPRKQASKQASKQHLDGREEGAGLGLELSKYHMRRVMAFGRPLLSYFCFLFYIEMVGMNDF